MSKCMVCNYTTEDVKTYKISRNLANTTGSFDACDECMYQIETGNYEEVER